jgi:lipid-A-disaccharide synthase
MLKIAIVAGEDSGDKLGAALIDGFDAILGEPAEFIGIAGPLMMDRGMDSLFDMSELSVMGISEILGQYLHLRKRLNQTIDFVLSQKPDVLITIDAPEFSLRLAKAIKAKSNIPTVHYVAPTVWAWRPKRAAKMARFVDHVLALFPFEPPLMTKEGMSCDFVGHPVTQESIATDAEARYFRQALKVQDAPIALCLPGSRMSEIRRMGPVFAQTIQRVKEVRPDIQWVLPAASHVAGAVRQMIDTWPVKPILLDPREMDPERAAAVKRAAFRAADVALATSGTVSLELAANDTPMVIAYDMNWLSRFIIGRLLLVDTVTLINIVTNTRFVPEFIGAHCKAEQIAPAVLSLLGNSHNQHIAMETTMRSLGRGAEMPGIRAAKSVMRFLERSEKA